VIGQSRVACIIEGALAGLDNKASRISSWGSVRQGAAVDSVDIFNLPKLKRFAASMVHGMDIFQAFFLKPGCNLEVCHDSSIILFSDGFNISNMITMSMTHKDKGCNHAYEIHLFGKLIRRNVRVKQYLFAVNLNQKCGMAIIGNCCHFKFDFGITDKYKDISLSQIAWPGPKARA